MMTICNDDGDKNDSDGNNYENDNNGSDKGVEHRHQTTMTVTLILNNDDD